MSEATLSAKEKGFTEPDPRDDLSGMDVARKLLILAREAGYQLELSDIDVEPVLPSSFDSTGDVESFLNRLPQVDVEFDAKVEEAQKSAKVLRYGGDHQ
ncbi:bifunctional aspartokinase I/homoserine dehydrogenase I [Proteus mirabilis]|uniref:Bifunctional aspartokinase I/homoserine dehydrogenase I n=1 Tax=Proteus mirabilis TaxID=584 RepID=A0A379FJ74_PROMI|nr:bifunctional aspartokinase I/homoserine dehydrogenase I [Proteus mirabilis]